MSDSRLDLLKALEQVAIQDEKITDSAPNFEERVAPWVGILKGRGKRRSPEERANTLREQRGSVDE